MGWIRPATPRLPVRPSRGGRVGWPVCAALAGVATGCGGEPPPRPLRPEFDLHHPSGLVRTRAAVAVAARRDTAHVPALIERLDDEDGAVRFSASAALREVTGHDTGYRPYMEPEERRRHVELWRAWWAARTGARPVPVVHPAPLVPAPARPPPRLLDARRP